MDCLTETHFSAQHNEFTFTGGNVMYFKSVNPILRYVLAVPTF